jgi:DNA polymerase-3 subunit epsilon
MHNLKLPWSEFTFVAFDTETSGAYPLASDVVEFGAVKWKGGKEIASFQTLLKPREKMSDFIIGIHGITNEMVETAPEMKEKISEIREFLSDAIPMAHHAPFDMGFMSVEFEKHSLQPPLLPVLCTSLLSRKIILESPNHKLQTLIQVLKLPQGAAHRALDDARACLLVGLECMKRQGEQSTLEQLIQAQGKNLNWGNYFLLKSDSEKLRLLSDAIHQKKDVEFCYSGGTLRGKPRKMSPIGIVRNPDGDYVVAICHVDRAQKKFYLDRVTDAQIIY